MLICKEGDKWFNVGGKGDSGETQKNLVMNVIAVAGRSFLGR